MTPPNRWLVALEGQPLDLEEFPFWFPTGDFHAVAESTAVYLTGVGFEKCQTPEEARGVAAQVLDEFGATISLLWPSYQAPILGTVHLQMQDGSRHGTQLGMVGTAVSRSKARGTLSIPIGEDQGPTQAQALWAAAKSNPHLETALLLWADPMRTWPRLYRIVEELEAHLSQTVSATGFCSGKERERFKRSANSAEVAGRDSRHVSGMFQPPSDPMSLRDATSFARAMITRTLQAHKAVLRIEDAV
jgi:hypothetical protein